MIPTIRVFCCRWWNVVPFQKWGKCGYCGQRPEVMEGDRQERPA